MAAAPSTAFESIGEHLKRIGRNWMVAIFLLLRLADVGFIYFAWHPENPIPLLKGVVLGSILWTTVFIGGVWQRRAWARYFLVAAIAGVIAVFALALIMLLADPMHHERSGLASAFCAIAAYGFCLVPLARSRAILRLSTTLGGVQR